MVNYFFSFRLNKFVNLSTMFFLFNVFILQLKVFTSMARGENLYVTLGGTDLEKYGESASA